jgi:hypothetical protein
MGTITERLDLISDSCVGISEYFHSEFGKRNVSLLEKDIFEYDYENIPRKAKFIIRVTSSNGLNLKFIFNFFDKERKIKNEVLILEEITQKKTKPINPIFLEREDILFYLSSFLKNEIKFDELFYFLNLF